MSNYAAYRCLIPYVKETGKPWFPYNDVCPCDTSSNITNITGRGYTPCALGINSSKQDTKQDYLSILTTPVGYFTDSEYKIKEIPVSQEFINNSGNLYQSSQYTAPQLWPRPLMQIGYSYRS